MQVMTRVHDAHPGKHAYWTEGGPDYTDPAYLTNWTRWSASFRRSSAARRSFSESTFCSMVTFSVIH